MKEFDSPHVSKLGIQPRRMASAAPAVYQPTRVASAQPSRKTPVQRMSAPPVYRPGVAPPVQRVAAPPVYRPNAAPALQRMTVPVIFKANPAAAIRTGPPSPAFHANSSLPIQPQAIRRIDPSSSGPALYRPIKLIPAPPRIGAGKALTPAVQRSASERKRSRAIQLHPLSIRIDGFYNWDRDTGVINFDADLDLYEQRIGAANQAISSIQVRKRRDQDHQVLVIGTHGDTQFTQMDLTGTSGAILRQGQSVEQDFYGELVDAFTPGGHTLGEAFRAFYETARDHGYSGEAYDCRRFISDVLSKLPNAKIIRSQQNQDVLDLFS